MTSTPRTRRLNRVVSLAFVGLLVGAFAAPAQVGATDTMTVSSAELAMVNALNADRTAVGLVPVRIDTRLMSIARARSADMVAKDYFSHTQPDGRNVFAILTAQHVTWYNAGEIIAWNMYTTLQDSVDGANYQWMHSSGHKAIIISTDFNYVGVGLAVSATGKKVWTAVYIKGPDRTGARATTALPTITAGTTSTSKRVSLNWSGADVRLQVLTSGFYSYQVQGRTDGGAWNTIWSSTTLKSATFNLGVNHTYEFRVAARDRAGNWGAWSTVTASLAAPVGSVIITR